MLVHAVVWVIAVATIGSIIFRPYNIPEWIAASVGALTLLALRCITPATALTGVGRGVDIYFFLIGMMLLAELSRDAGVFDWVASLAVAHGNGSQKRLFLIIYAIGVIVTIVLSNDATAVVLTPAVAVAVKRAKTNALPHLFACAFVANAASFVLPISNPANLVVFGASVPTLDHWITLFMLPSLLVIAATCGLMLWIFRNELGWEYHAPTDVVVLSLRGKVAVAAIFTTVMILVTTSLLGGPLGLVAAMCGGAALSVSALQERDSTVRIVKNVSWSVLLLVAGLFVIVEALGTTGLHGEVRALLTTLSKLPPAASLLSVAGCIAVAANAMNNLPAGVIFGESVAGMHVTDAFRAAVAIAIDLGPNLAVTGSLSSLLWLIVLRREGFEIYGRDFLRVGIIVMPITLALAVLALTLRAA